MTESDTSTHQKTIGKLLFGTSVLVLLIKFYAWYSTDSAAIYSDALESIVNVFTAITAWIAFKIAQTPADKEHPYGHGKIEYFSSGFEGTLILIAGFTIFLDAFDAFLHPKILNDLSLGIALIALTAVINAIAGYFLLKKAAVFRSETLHASGKHVLSDAVTTAGVIVALLLVGLTEIHWIDPLIAFFIAVHISFQGVKLIKNAILRLMDGADSDSIDKISICLMENRKEFWIAPHKLRTWRSGSKLFVDFHLIMPWYFTLKQTHEVEHNIKSKFCKHLQEPVELHVHIEPCFPEACKYCRMRNCMYRTQAQEVDLVWDRERLISIPEFPKPIDIL